MIGEKKFSSISNTQSLLEDVHMNQTIARIKKTNTVIPTDLNEANALLCDLGSLQDEINAAEKELKEKIAALKMEAAKKLESTFTKRDNLTNALFAFAQPRQTDLTKDARSIALRCGTFGWRLTPPRVELASSEEEIIAVLKGNDKADFVRVKETLDRALLLEKKPCVEGISYVQNDEFFVVPVQKFEKPKTLMHAIDRVK